MILSNRNGLKNTRNMLRVFGGLNETYSCTEAEYSAGINFSARNFPALSTRLPRRKLREETFENKKIITIANTIRNCDEYSAN